MSLLFTNPTEDNSKPSQRPRIGRGSQKKLGLYGLIRSVDPAAGMDYLVHQGNVSSYVVCIAIVLIAMLASTAFISMMLVDTSHCEGPPYLYVTGESGNNVWKFSRNGCSFSPNILFLGPKYGRQLRQIRTGVYKNQDALYVADSSERVEDNSSQILVFGSCSEWNSQRSYRTTVVSDDPKSQTYSSLGAVHPYSMTFDVEGNLYASFKATNSVLRFTKNSFTPMPFPKYITRDKEDKKVKKTKAGGGHSHASNASTSTTSADAVSFASNATSGWDEVTIINNFKRTSVKHSATNTTSHDIEPTPFAGTFVQFGYPETQSIDNRGMRAIVWVTMYSSSSSSSPPAIPRTGTGVNKIPGYDSRHGDNGDRGNTATTTAAALGYWPESYIHVASSGDISDAATDSSTLFEEELWIAFEYADTIFVVDKYAKEVARVKIRAPIGLFYDASRELVFVGSRYKKTKKFKRSYRGGSSTSNGADEDMVDAVGAVYALDARTKQLNKTFIIPGKKGLEHPAGITVYKDTLFVAEKSFNAILSFNITTGRFISQVYSGFGDDVVNNLELSNC